MPQYLTITEAAAILPGRPHRNTIVRWMQHGCQDRSDPPQLIKLRSVRFGQKRLTQDTWIAEFCAAVTGRLNAPAAEHHAAEAALDKLNV